MYLTAGLYKGRKIIVPDGVKPTLSKVRQGVFNMLNRFDFPNNSFLDMFCGSGLMSLEAVSRGYSAVGIEKNIKNVQIIKKNYSNLDLKADIVCADALKFKTDKKFYVIYLDPPWNMDYEPIISKAKTLLEENGIIIVEYDELQKIDIKKLASNLELTSVKDKKYGRALINFLK